MRDPARIPLVLDALARVWSEDPDMRFGQLVENVARTAGLHAWHSEDEAWIAAIDAFAAQSRAWKAADRNDDAYPPEPTVMGAQVTDREGTVWRREPVTPGKLADIGVWAAVNGWGRMLWWRDLVDELGPLRNSFHANVTINSNTLQAVCDLCGAHAASLTELIGTSCPGEPGPTVEP